MNIAAIALIRRELEDALAGRRFGKIFQLSKFEIAVDFRLPDSRYLFISIEPGDPRVYLIKRRMKDLEKASGNPSPFSMFLRKRVSEAEVAKVVHLEGERVLRMDLTAVNEMGTRLQYSLLIQLTGRSANLFLLDKAGAVLESARDTHGPGQEIGDLYAPPARPDTSPVRTPGDVPVYDGFESLSEALDARTLEKKEDDRFRSLAAAAQAKLKQEITKRQRLVKKLEGDLAGHGDAEKWKRWGDLLLANVSTSERDGERVFVIDYFSDAMETVEIEADENDSITEAAEKFFKRYTKARNAKVEIEERLDAANAELKRLFAQKQRLEAAIADRDEDLLTELAGGKRQIPTAGRKVKQPDTASGTRSFTSSDGYEILVGKKAKDNDFLTFRIAKSLDTWMHAADYPGSHVVIRNPNRKEIPHATLLEAAQLAAFYSQGKSQPKAAVHYTQKKFVNKPKGSAPGLVSLASFKTILVEPKVPFDQPQ